MGFVDEEKLFVSCHAALQSWMLQGAEYSRYLVLKHIKSWLFLLVNLLLVVYYKQCVSLTSLLPHVIGQSVK